MTDRLICFQDWFDFVIYQNSSGEPKSVMEWVYNIQQTKKSVKKYGHVAKGTLENIQNVVSNKFWHQNKIFVFLKYFVRSTDKLNSNFVNLECASHTQDFQSWNLVCLFITQNITKIQKDYFVPKYQKIVFYWYIKLTQNICKFCSRNWENKI